MGKNRNQKNSKPRSDWICAELNGVVDHFSFAYDPITDSIRFDNNRLNSSHLVRSYERDSGKDKIVTSVQSKNGDVTFNQLTFLKNNFDHLVAVDTNQMKYPEGNIAVTFAYYVPDVLSNYGNRVPFFPFVGYAMIDVDPRINPEVLGWNLVIQSQLGSITAQRRRIGLVVDSELDKVDRFNSGELPYIGTEKLPKHVQLIYASDAVSDTIYNQMLRYCHKVSNLAKKEIVNKINLIPWSSSPYCRGVVQFQGKSI